MTAPVTVAAAAATHVGLVRTTNQDCLHVAGWSSSRSGARLQMDVPQRAVLAVIDGMGGQPGGELASWTVSRSLNEFRFDADTTIDDIGAAVRQLSDDVREAGRATVGHSRMGATIAGIAFAPCGIVLFNVGDSSILRISGDYVGQLAEIDRVGAHSVGQCLGGTEHPTAVDAHEMMFDPRDHETLILCTDGLTDCVDVDRVAELAKQFDGIGLAQALIAAACESGAPDNVSVIVVDITAEPGRAPVGAEESVAGEVTAAGTDS